MSEWLFIQISIQPWARWYVKAMAMAFASFQLAALVFLLALSAALAVRLVGGF